MSSDNEFEKGESGGNLTYPLAGGSVRKGNHIMIKEHPCKVTEISVSKTGKHGHAKAHVFGLDIFTGKKYEDVFPTSHNVDAPFVNKQEFEVVSIEDGEINYMNEDGDIEEIRVDEDDEIYIKLQKADEEGKDLCISVMTALGQCKVVSYRETKG